MLHSSPDLNKLAELIQKVLQDGENEVEVKVRAYVIEEKDKTA